MSERILKQIIKVCLYLVPLVPVLVVGKFLFPFITPKTLYFRLLIEIALFFYIILVIGHRQYFPRFSKLTWAVLVYLLLISLAAVLGMNPYRSFWGNIERGEGLLTIYHLFAFFILLTALLRTKREWLRFFDISVGVSLLVALYALGQKFNLGFLLKSAGGTRLTATIGNASFLAAYLLLSIFLILFLFVNKKKRSWRIFYGLAFLFEGYILFETETRGALLGILGGFVLLALLNILFSKNRKVKINFAALVLILIILASFIWLSRDQGWVQKNNTLRRMTSISYSDITTQSRLLGWQAAWRAWQDRFLFGYGYENFNIAFNKYFPTPIYRDPGSQVWFDRAHNIVFDQAVPNGLFGLLAYLTILLLTSWALLRSMIKSRKKKKETVDSQPGPQPEGSEKNLSFFSFSILIALLVAYFVQNLFVFDTLGTYILFYSLLAMSSVLVFEKQQLTVSQRMAAQSKAVRPSLFLISLLVIIFIFAAYLFNLKPAMANYYGAKSLAYAYFDQYRQAVDYYRKALSYGTYQASEIRQSFSQVVVRAANSGQFNPEENRNNFDFAIAEMEKTLAAAPNNARHYLFAMSLYNSAARYDLTRLDRVVALGEKALKLSPSRPQFYYLMGQARIKQGRNKEGLAYLKKALEMSPEVIEAHWNLAAAYIIIGQDDLAEEEFKQMEALGFDYYSMENLQKLAQPYYIRGDYDKVIELYQEMIKLEPNNSSLYLNLAVLYKTVGQKDKAKETALRALEIDSSLADQVDAFIKSLIE